MCIYSENDESIAFHPGYYLKEVIEELNLTQSEFAQNLGVTEEHLCELLVGTQNLTIDVVSKLSEFMGTSVEFWMNLQRSYSEAISKSEEKND